MNRIKAILLLILAVGAASHSHAQTPTVSERDALLQAMKNQYLGEEATVPYFIYLGNFIKNKKTTGSLPPLYIDEGDSNPTGHYWAHGSKVGKFQDLATNRYWLYLLPAYQGDTFFTRNIHSMNPESHSTLATLNKGSSDPFGENLPFLLEFNSRDKRNQMYSEIANGHSIDIADCIKIAIQSDYYSYRVVYNSGFDFQFERYYQCTPNDSYKTIGAPSIPWGQLQPAKSHNNKNILLSYGTNDSAHYIVNPMGSSGDLFVINLFISDEGSHDYLNRSLIHYDLPGFDFFQPMEVASETSGDLSENDGLPTAAHEIVLPVAHWNMSDEMQKTKQQKAYDGKLARNRFRVFIYEVFHDARFNFGDSRVFYKLNLDKKALIERPLEN